MLKRHHAPVALVITEIAADGIITTRETACGETYTCEDRWGGPAGLLEYAATWHGAISAAEFEEQEVQAKPRAAKRLPVAVDFRI